MACSSSEQLHILSPCVLAPVAILSLIDLRSRLRLGHGGQRLPTAVIASVMLPKTVPRP
jgi:hypothetical protein